MALHVQNVVPKLNAKLEIASSKRLRHRNAILLRGKVSVADFPGRAAKRKSPGRGRGFSRAFQ